MTFHTTAAPTAHFGHACQCLSGRSWTSQSVDLRCRVCLLRIVASLQAEAGRNVNKTYSKSTCSHDCINVCRGGRFHTVRANPLHTPSHTPLSPLAAGFREGGEVGKQPALVLVSDFGHLWLVFFRKHLLGLQLHEGKRSPTWLPGQLARVRLHSGERDEFA